jgi:predicted DNA-binding transcriptional regulator AlpA
MRSFSIDEWCALHGFSRPYFYRLEAKGIAPRGFYIGKMRRISEQANAEWIAAREAEPLDAEAARTATAAARKAVGSRRDRKAAA